MKAFFYTALEKALNRYLALDPESMDRLSLLNNKVVLIKFRGVIGADDSSDQYSGLFLEIQNGMIKFVIVPYKHPDVIIKGTPLSLLHMSIAKQNRKQFFADDVQIEGDLEIGQHIIDLFDQLEIDWEEKSSHVLGDVAAHQLGRFVRGIKRFAGAMQESIFQNVKEYVHEEALIFPPKEALHDFFNDIDVLRMDADRLEVRIMHLIERKRNAGAS